MHPRAHGTLASRTSSPESMCQDPVAPIGRRAGTASRLMWGRSMTGLLDGKVAVITGAGSGMAKASTRLFVAEGARAVAADISGAEKDTAAEIGAEHGDVVLPVHCDVTQEHDVAALFEAAVAEFGKVDAILNVAGIGLSAPLHKFDMEV